MKAWLTQIPVDTRHAQVRRDLHDVVALHRRIMTLVSDQLGDQPRHTAGLLFRVEDDHPRPRILVQTALAPDTSRMPAGMGTAQTKELTALLDAFHTGMSVHYRITANTSKRLATDPRHGRRAPVVALRGIDAEAWWTRRAPRCGLALHSVGMRPLDDLRGNRDGTHVRHAATRFDGVAVVTDPDALRTAVLSGVGRGKSYGCGLLSIAPMGGAR